MPINEDEIEAKEALEAELAETKATLLALQSGQDSSKPSTISPIGDLMDLDRVKTLEIALAEAKAALHICESEHTKYKQGQDREEKHVNKLSSFEQELAETKGELQSGKEAQKPSEKELKKLMKEHEVLLDEHAEALGRLHSLDHKAESLHQQLQRGTSECVVLLKKLEVFASALHVPILQAEKPPERAGKSTNIVALLTRQVELISKHS